MSDARVEPVVDAAARLKPGDSAIADLSYRNYDGPLRARFVRWWVVAQSGLRSTWGQGWFYAIAVLPLLRFLLGGFLMYIRSQLAGGMPNYMGEPEGQKYALQFWSILCGDTNCMMVLLIALIAGSGSIAADNRANALLVYFSKPISKLDYLVGKWMSIFLTILAATLAPAALLYLYCIVSYRETGFFTDEPWLGPHLLLAVLVPAILHSSLLVGISAWSKSPRIVTAIYTSLYILSGIVVFIIGNFLYRNQPELQNIIQHCSIRGLIIGISQNLMHCEVPGLQFRRGGVVSVVEIPKLVPLLSIASALVIGGLTAAWLKIRAVEVIRG